MRDLKIPNKTAKNFATIGVGLLIIAILIMGLFFIDKSHRDSRLSAYAQSLDIPAQCIKVTEEYITGQFTPVDEILYRAYTCRSNSITIGQAITFFTSKGFKVQQSTLTNTYVLQKDGYYYAVRLQGVGDDEPIITNEKASGSELGLASMEIYTGFHIY